MAKHSPRQGEPSDEVRIRGEPTLVAKLKAELEQRVATLRDRVTLAVDIPAPQHRMLIGRGGQNLNEIEQKFDVKIQFPGSRTYNQAGKPENLADFADADPANIVKVSGSRAAVEKALVDLKVCLHYSVRNSSLSRNRRATSELLLRTRSPRRSMCL